MRISFSKFQHEFEPILINGDALEVVENVKLLGLNISSNILSILMKLLRKPLRDYIF